MIKAILLKRGDYFIAQTEEFRKKEKSAVTSSKLMVFSESTKKIKIATFIL